MSGTSQRFRRIGLLSLYGPVQSGHWSGSLEAIEQVMCAFDTQPLQFPHGPSFNILVAGEHLPPPPSLVSVTLSPRQGSTEHNIQEDPLASLTIGSVGPILKNIARCLSNR